MHPRKKAVGALRGAGYRLEREGANHEIYKHPETGDIIPLKRHDFNDNDLKYILKEIKQSQVRKDGRQH